MASDGSHVILFKNNERNEVFLVYRSDYPLWVTQGGGIEKNESPKQAALREAYEETGFKIKIIRKVGVYTNSYKSHLYEGRYVSGKFKPEFPGCRGKWFKVTNLPFETTKRTRVKIHDCLSHNGKQFVKQEVGTKIKDNFHLLIIHPVSSIKYFLRRLLNNY